MSPTSRTSQSEPMAPELDACCAEGAGAPAAICILAVSIASSNCVAERGERGAVYAGQGASTGIPRMTPT